MNPFLISRHFSRTVIDACKILPHEDIERIDRDESVLFEKFATNFSALHFLCKYRLFKNYMLCLYARVRVHEFSEMDESP